MIRRECLGGEAARVQPTTTLCPGSGLPVSGAVHVRCRCGRILPPEDVEDAGPRIPEHYVTAWTRDESQP